MGNRGCLHDDQRRLVRQFSTYKAWVSCLTEFKGGKRKLMTPGHYTELFFLDEATALAAGHQPCGECRRADYRRFKSAWLAGNPDAGLVAKPSIGEIDNLLQKDRLTEDRRKRVFRVSVGSLTDGARVHVQRLLGGKRVR